MTAITIEVAPGELIDKLTILAIKLDRMTDPDKRANVSTEHRVLESVHRNAVPSSLEIKTLTAELRGVNEALWDIEDRIRDCERLGNFGPEFISLARAIYKTNDRRAAIKKAINQHLGSRLVEEKSYQNY